MPPKKKTINVQPELNIGLIGHVDHGKTTLVRALSGKWTDTHSEEMKRGITIRLGYADVRIFKYAGVKGAEAYGLKEKNDEGKKGELVKTLSLVDAPGHESLMATMLCGANIMDGALLLISASEDCPQPQTQEHLMALEITGVKNVIVLQNKIDLISAEQAKKNYEQIKEFLKGTSFEKAPIIPISALHNINIDYLLQTILEMFKEVKRETKKEPLMFVARSFDINKPGSEINNISGGVLGGVLKQGILKTGEEIEIRPGYFVEEKNQKVWKPLTAKIEKLMSGGTELKEVQPGGTFALLTSLDPSIVKSDQLVGSVVGHKDKLPEVRNELTLKITLLDRAVGSKDKLVIEPPKPKEALMMNVYSSATVGVITEIKKETIKCILKRPVCAEKGAKVTLSRMMGQRWRLIGYGEIE